MYFLLTYWLSVVRYYILSRKNTNSVMGAYAAVLKRPDGDAVVHLFGMTSIAELQSTSNDIRYVLTSEQYMLHPAVAYII